MEKKMESEASPRADIGVSVKQAAEALKQLGKIMSGGVGDVQDVRLNLYLREHRYLRDQMREALAKCLPK